MYLESHFISRYSHLGDNGASYGSLRVTTSATKEAVINNMLSRPGHRDGSQDTALGVESDLEK
jgi:hypothetical protein